LPDWPGLKRPSFCCSSDIEMNLKDGRNLLTGLLWQVVEFGLYRA
jgi:hypothetical protein